jgi:hypothetical protein
MKLGIELHNFKHNFKNYLTKINKCYKEDTYNNILMDIPIKE